MKIDLSSVQGRDYEPHGPPVQGLYESRVIQELDNIGFVIIPEHQIEITMLAGLLTDQCVDAPPATDPGGKACLLQPFQYG